MAGMLDMDMTTLAQTLRGGFAWWADELAGMVPASLRRLAAPRPGVTAVLVGETFALSRNGVPLPPADPAQPVAAAIVLPASLVLTRTLPLPAVGRRDLAQLIALEIDRLMPFPPGSAVFDFETGEPAGNGRVLVTVAAMPRATAAGAVTAARSAGLVPRRLGLASGFDFLPQLGERGSSGAARFWWTLVAVLAAALVATLIVRDVQRTRALDALVTAHGEGAASARALRLRVLAEDARRRTWLARREARDPLRLLAAATRALPDNAWVQRLDFDGTRLRLVGFKNGGVDTVAALRTAAVFGAVRPSSSDIAPPQPLGQPFDVTAELANPR